MRGLALVLLFLSSFAALAAKPSATPNRFGAIAYERASKSWGISYDKARARDAELEALRQCGQKRCEVVHKFKNGCAALADGPGAKKPAAASGATRDEAETKALKRCGAGCTPLAWGCTR
jgi:hypothetical protein